MQGIIGGSTETYHERDTARRRVGRRRAMRLLPGAVRRLLAAYMRETDHPIGPCEVGLVNMDDCPACRVFDVLAQMEG